MPEQTPWQVQPVFDVPDAYVRVVRSHAEGLPGRYAAQLLWQRGLRDLDVLPGFLNPDRYIPTSPFAFGQEMQWAVERLHRAQQTGERVAIWGDFDADGITATAVLWQGLGHFFPQLTYFIPNRLTDSHGLAQAGIARLAEQGYSLIVTCDTGSSNLTEIRTAQEYGIDVIITDHHTLPIERPPVVAIINPRSLPADHPLANLSGVAVAYKLVEAVCQTLPTGDGFSPEYLLDLVAIGLIADLVQLTGDGRYLAQRGIEQLQQQQTRQPPTRPGIVRLLELCKRNGDRPTDISFGIGPRINAISRIQGDARFCVELLTSQDVDRCRQLADETELANTRRKSLQREMLQQVKARLTTLDLSTTRVIVLSDPQWSIGILGLVAGQIAQEYGRPTILLNGAIDEPGSEARGSARSIDRIDLYQFVQEQAHLLHRFGGHPLAMGLSLPVDNIALFTEAINRRLREQLPDAVGRAGGRADLIVTAAELGKDLFRELKLLEPYSIGNPAPKLLIQNCWFKNAWNRNIQDHKGRKVRYIKTEFELWDDTTQTGFPGIWWDHYRDEIPPGRCDAIVELDFNPYKKRYEIRLLALRPAAAATPAPAAPSTDWLLDWRTATPDAPPEVLPITTCPSSWDELQVWFRRAEQTGKLLAIAYPPPSAEPAEQIWQRLVGIVKYLSRLDKPMTRHQFYEKLEIGDRSLQLGFSALTTLGFTIISSGTSSGSGYQFSWQPPADPEATGEREAIAQFIAAVHEEQFRRRYFYEVPLTTIQAVARQMRAS